MGTGDSTPSIPTSERFPDALPSDRDAAKQTYLSLLESYDLLEEMSKLVGVAAWKVDVKTNKIYWTKGLYSLYEMEIPSPLTFENILELELPPYRPIHQKAVADLMENGTSFDIEVETYTLKGNLRWFRIVGKPVYQEGKLTHRMGITLDITERKRLMQEKEALLREVHHRVKNHFNTVIGLLDLQSSTTEHPQVQESLSIAKLRLKTLSVLYNKLYLSKNLHLISLKQYLDDLVKEIISSYPITTPLQVQVSLPELYCDPVRLSYLGIIVNELVTNALKYAFVGSETGRLEITGKEEGAFLHLTIQDDGVGLPESIPSDNSTSFGVQMVQLLVERLQGTLEISRIQGTRFTMQIPLEVHKPEKIY
ncbi:MAG: histidine kinase dimerization/phosphoacceptor domain -containing protein [Spirochaetales bacterium]